MYGIETIGEITNYRRRRMKQLNSMNYKNEYDRLIGELSQINVPYSLRHKIEQRKRTIKQAYQYSQLAKNIILLQIYICQTYSESITQQLNLVLQMKSLFIFEAYPVKYPDRSATFITESALLTQFDGSGMMELEDQERKNAEKSLKDKRKT